jgi:hypothetical protein
MTTSKPADAEAKKGPGRPKKGEASTFNFAALEFRPAEMPKKAEASNPFVKPLGESYEYDEARAAEVPASELRRAEGLLRRAADVLGIGVTVQSGEPVDGMVLLVFKGKERRKHKSKGTAETAETTETAETAEKTAEDAPAAGSTPAAEDTASAVSRAAAS